MKIIKIQSDPSNPKKTIWLDGGLHAREWITVPTVTYIAETLLRTYNTPAGSNSSTFLLDNFDFIVAPVLNVDGFDYTWNGDRMWRKTRSPNGKSPCMGTDPNRNWAFHWGEAGSSTVTCSDSYQGPSAASEIEVQTIQSYLCGIDNLVGYINFHAYSQLWMSPWGYTDALPPDYKDQNALSAAATEAIKSVYGTTYEYGPIATTIYPASGSSADYVYGVCGAKYAYGVELRDTGEFGFLLPPNQIIPSGEETYAGIVAMGRYINDHP
jgi:murein tripeptide amidase MpaA